MVLMMRILVLALAALLLPLTGLPSADAPAQGGVPAPPAAAASTGGSTPGSAPDAGTTGLWAPAPHREAAALHTSLAGLPGYLGTAPGPVAVFSGDVPDDVAVAAIGNVAPQRLRMEVLSVTDIGTDHVRSDGVPPLPEDAVGIGPGSPLLQNIGGSWYICTANFVFQDSGKYYLGSAGHCFLEEDDTASHGSGADADLRSITVEVCVAFCHFGGLLQGFLGDMVTLGSPTYARQTGSGGDIGNDFGVVEIPSQYHHLIRPDMPMWGGPTGADGNEGTGRPIVHYGNGIEAGTFFTSKGRMGTSLNDGDGRSWQAIASIAGGDSGSAVNHAIVGGTDIVEGAKALGLVTHGLIVPGVPLGWGTTIEQAISMAREANLQLELVLPGGTVAPPPTTSTPTDLEATASQRGRNQVVDLAWTGGASNVDILVNGAVDATTTNSGSYTVNLGKNPKGTYTFTVCNAGTTQCSNAASVTY